MPLSTIFQLYRVLCNCLYGLVSLCKSCLRLYFVQICFMFYLAL